MSQFCASLSRHGCNICHTVSCVLQFCVSLSRHGCNICHTVCLVCDNSVPHCHVMAVTFVTLCVLCVTIMCLIVTSWLSHLLHSVSCVSQFCASLSRHGCNICNTVCLVCHNSVPRCHVMAVTFVTQCVLCVTILCPVVTSWL